MGFAEENQIEDLKLEVSMLGRKLDDERAEVARLTLERDWLIEACLQQAKNGRWSASLAGNYELGTFDTREEAIEEVRSSLGLDAAADSPKGARR